MPDAAPAPETDAPTAATAPGGCGIVWSDDLCEYDFGPYHPMSPVRLTLTRELARCAGVLDRPGVRTIEPVIATDEQLGAVHDADYIAAVRAASALRGMRRLDGDDGDDEDD
ncbi:MAG: acetoin utilization protein AcuC, partial [Brachybacterium sp.]|nr:acetoin utilization protein AcuC [Brachybacterium sp.]